MDTNQNKRQIRTSAATSSQGQGQRRTIKRTGASRSGVVQTPQNTAARHAKKRKKSRLKRLLIVATCVLGALFVGLFGLYTYVMHSLAPEGGGPSISDLINTPTEYKGDVVNILVCGIDYEEGRVYSNDPTSNDGMTDMILYAHFNVKERKISLLQIPRDTYAGESFSTGGTGKINAVGLKNNGIASLSQLISEQYGLPVDYYVTIDMQSLKEIVDRFSYITVYVPQDMSYNGSMLQQGYRNLDGDAVEFFVRNRNYAQGDIKRLDMQRYFYQGLFARIRTATVWDIAKLTPVALHYVTTDIPGDKLISLGVSFLKVDSADIMLCKVPTYSAAALYNNLHAIQVCDVAKTLPLINEYFLNYTTPLTALNVPTVAVSGSSTDPNVQYMGQIDNQVSENSN